MVDVVDPATRSRMMAGIKGKDTKPEMLLRRALHARGFRYRLHDRNLPGRPDLVFPRHRAAIMVNGCFWHHHKGCRYATVPASRPEFWSEKLNANADRDERNRAALAADGWRVGIIWECALRRSVAEAAEQVAVWIVSGAADQLDVA